MDCTKTYKIGICTCGCSENPYYISEDKHGLRLPNAILGSYYVVKSDNNAIYVSMDASSRPVVNQNAPNNNEVVLQAFPVNVNLQLKLPPQPPSQGSKPTILQAGMNDVSIEDEIHEIKKPINVDSRIQVLPVNQRFSNPPPNYHQTDLGNPFTAKNISRSTSVNASSSFTDVRPKISPKPTNLMKSQSFSEELPKSTIQNTSHDQPKPFIALKISTTSPKRMAPMPPGTTISVASKVKSIIARIEGPPPPPPPPMKGMPVMSPNLEKLPDAFTEDLKILIQNFDRKGMRKVSTITYKEKKQNGQHQLDQALLDALKKIKPDTQTDSSEDEEEIEIKDWNEENLKATL